MNKLPPKETRHIWPARTGMGPLCAAALASAAISVSGGASFAQDTARQITIETEADPAASSQEAKRELEQKREELKAAETKAKTIQGDVADIDADREKLNLQLQDTAGLIQRTEGQLTSIEGRLGELEAQEKLVRGSLLQRHNQIAQLLGALQRMGRNPPPVLITKREDALQMVRSAMLLSSAFPELKGQALTLSGRLEELVRVMGDIRSEGERLKSETARLNEARSRLAGLMEAKKLSLTDRQQELAAVRSVSTEISKSVGDLSDLIGKLDKTVAEKTGLGGYQAQRARQVVTPPPAAPTTATIADATPEAPPEAAETETKVAALLPPPRLKPEVIELAPSNTGMGAANPGRIAPAIPFIQAHAKLPMPAQGRRVLAFGEKTQYGANSKGIVVETRQGAQITSPCDGWIVYAGEFRSYGQLLIINAGDGYHVLLAGMSQIDVVPGQFVLAAEPIGTMSGAVKTSQPTVSTNAPVLYIEFRKDGRPIDPDPWWVAGQQKVQK